MFLGKWGFGFRGREYDTLSVTGDRISPHMDDTFPLLKKYHGIQITEYQPDSADEMISIIDNHLRGNKPIIMFVDAYWCPWDPGYQKYHNMHFVIVIGYNSRSRMFTCVDGFFVKEREELPASALYHYSSVCYSICDLGKPDATLTFEEAATCTVKKLSVTHNMVDDIVAFSQDIELHFNYEEEVKRYQDKWWASPLFKRLIKISQGRKLFAEAIEYFQDQRAEGIRHQLNLCSKQWDNLRIMLIKASYSSNAKPVLRRVSEKLEEISRLEQAILESLHPIAASLIDVDGMKPNVRVDKMKHVPLEEYMNHRAFGSFDKPAYFYKDTFFLAHDLPSKSIWWNEEVSFSFPVYDGETNDHVRAQGQHIPIVADEPIRKVYLLAAFTEASPVAIQFYDFEGTRSVHTVQGAHWLASQSKHQTPVVLAGQLTRVETGQVELIPQLGRITVLSVELPTPTHIASIILDYNEHFRLFAITINIDKKEIDK
ncbi:BtrH N-terminal domain-containing protein [Paenibacillus herberti]|uniref:Butirosin biosynthesis protein H N-terminal domain-containing protein n=1 Tax=Paenibacillus herberti TaxID=1619309 RepID=A0A229NVH9_9BACL|nr:BtrH N-terminal domain-containing protein [Paenibacillus herberti]OXM13897.1 hypothetical protein CGZ75_12855 [Paenibacillus herberti]